MKWRTHRVYWTPMKFHENTKNENLFIEITSSERNAWYSEQRLDKHTKFYKKSKICDATQ